MGIIILTLLLVAFISFTISYFLFKRKKSNPLGSFQFWLIFMIMTPILFISGTFVWYKLSAQYNHQPFSSKAWSENYHTRYVYVEDLISNKTLLGKTGEKIKTLLGEPDSQSDSTLVYYLGYDPQYFMNSDPDWLIIKLSDGQSVQMDVDP